MHMEIMQIAKGSGWGRALGVLPYYVQEANGDVPLDGVAFSSRMTGVTKMGLHFQ